MTTETQLCPDEANSIFISRNLRDNVTIMAEPLSGNRWRIWGYEHRDCHSWEFKEISDSLPELPKNYEWAEAINRDGWMIAVFDINTLWEDNRDQ